MGRVLHEIEKGIRISKENSDTLFVDFIFDAGSPAGTAGETDVAPIGSIYTNSTNGGIWKKTASTSSASDWTELGDVTIDELNWRNETVRFATNDTIAVGSIDVLALSDNDDMVYGDVVVGDHVLGDCNGTPALFEVTATPGTPNITLAAASQALADNDTFIVQQYLPDPTGQEGQAIIHFPLASGACVKIGDVNWEFATGINLTGGYASGNGSISSSDNVETAIQKLDGNQQDIQSASGISQGAVDYGTFTGDSLADSQTAKQLFQRLEVLLEQMRGVQVTGLTTLADVDSVPVASVTSVKWLVEAFEEATPANRKSFEVYALGDATNQDDTIYAKLKIGANFNLVLVVDHDSGNLRLRASSSTGGVTITARRIEVVQSVL